MFTSFFFIKKRKLLSFLLLYFCVLNFCHTKALGIAHPQATKQNIQFGIQGGIGILRGSFSGGIFGEYELASQMSIYTGLMYFCNLYFLNGLVYHHNGPEVKLIGVLPEYIILPVIFKIYLDFHKKGCLLIGGQVGYLIRGKAELYECIHHKIQAPPISLKKKDSNLKVNRIELAAIAGYDYRFKFGLSIGVRFIQELIPVIDAKSTMFIWTLQPSIGYNLARLLH
jgi:hypothetical protein